MKLNQAWGWLFAGVVAAGLNASYHDGGLEWAHRAVNQASYNVSAVLALASGRADQFAAEVQMVSARNETPSCRFAAALAQIENKVGGKHANFDRFEAMTARQQAQLARFEAQRVRMENKLAAIQIRTANFTPVVNIHPADFQNFEIPAACSRVRVNIPRMPVIKMPVVPVVHVDVTSPGPV